MIVFDDDNDSKDLKYLLYDGVGGEVSEWWWRIGRWFCGDSDYNGEDDGDNRDADSTDEKIGWRMSIPTFIYSLGSKWEFMYIWNDEKAFDS